MKKQILLLATLCCWFTLPALCGNGINMHSGVVYTCLANLYDQGGPANNYANNLQDTLIIYPPANLPNAKICITFHKFDVENINDYLRVYDGNSVAAPLIKELSGGIKYGSIKSTAADGSLTLLFHSNNTSNAEGWFASVTLDTLPDDITMIASGKWYTSGGRFFDSGGPNNNYENNANVTTTIFPENPGDKISVVFNECNIRQGDILTIFDGSAAGVNPIGQITGSAVNYGTVTSSAADGSLTFVFTSNASVNEAGWTASIITNYHPEDITTMANGVYNISTGRFFDSGGAFNDYPEGANSTVTTILPKSAGEKISVTFHECDIASGDYLEVFDADNVNGTPMAVITGLNTGTVHASNATGALTFRFVTNASGSAPGWIASVTTHTTAEEITMLANQSFVVNCFARFYDNGGTVDNYANAKNCVTTLFPSSATDKLNITFHSFALSANDYLYVYDGPDTNSTLLGSYTGTLNSFSLESTHATGSLTFKFVSNTSGNNIGWFATVNCSSGIQSYNMPLNTSANYTTSSAYFYDNGGPNANYSDNSGLSSVVTFFPVNSNEKLSVSFTYFDTYSIDDYLEVYDGDNVFTAPMLGKLYNRAAYGTLKATNSAGCLTFRFVSNGGSNRGGWAAYISTTVIPQVFSLPGTYVANEGIFMDAGGNGGNYTDQYNHIFTFTPVSAQDKASLKFVFVSTYNANDFLEIHDGPSITDPIIAVLNNRTGHGSIKASASNPTGSLTVKFVSDNGSNSLGWAAILNTDSLPEVISMPGTYTINEPKTFYDQGGPHANYTDNENTITCLRPSNVGDKVSIMFSRFKHYDNNDYIEVHNGPSVTDPVIAKLGSDGGYGTIVSTHPTGCLTIQTVTSSGFNQSGWSGYITVNAAPKIFSMTGNYNSDNGFLMDNGGPDINYNDNTNDVITVTPQQSNSYLTVNFNYFYNYNSSDSIRIFNGNSTNAPLLAVLKADATDTSFTSTAVDGSLTFQIITSNGFTSTGWVAAISSSSNCYYTGVNETEALLNQVSVYPNPASHNIQIDLSALSNNDAIIEIMEVSGKLLQKFNTRDKFLNVQLTYAPGLYLVKISSMNGSIMKKLIIQ